MLSPDALEVAAENVDIYELEDHLTLYQGDLFAPLGDTRYDLIISNPPYVDAQGMAELPDECRYEPEMALDGGADGLPEPAAVLERWRGLLAPGGALHVAAPVEGSLREWREFLRASGLEDSLWAFPRPDFAAPCEIVDFPARFESALAFARSLKKSGAHRAAPGSRPLPAPALRKALAAHVGPFTATFRVGFVRMEAPAARQPRER